MSVKEHCIISHTTIESSHFPLAAESCTRKVQSLCPRCVFPISVLNKIVGDSSEGPFRDCESMTLRLQNRNGLLELENTVLIPLNCSIPLHGIIKPPQ